MKHKFGKEIYKIKTGDFYKSECDPPNASNKKIKLSTAVGSKMRWVHAIHEALHACFWIVDEEIIDKVDSQIFEYLKKLVKHGYLDIKALGANPQKK